MPLVKRSPPETPEDPDHPCPKVYLAIWPHLSITSLKDSSDQFIAKTAARPVSFLSLTKPTPHLTTTTTTNSSLRHIQALTLGEHSYTSFLKPHTATVNMSDQVQEILDLPKDFVREGSLFINRCTKPDGKEFVRLYSIPNHLSGLLC